MVWGIFFSSFLAQLFKIEIRNKSHSESATEHSPMTKVRWKGMENYITLPSCYPQDPIWFKLLLGTGPAWSCLLRALPGWVLNTSSNGDSTTAPGPVSVWAPPGWSFPFPNKQLQFPWWRQQAACILPVHLQPQLGLAFISPLWELQNTGWSSFCLFQRLNMPSTLPALLHCMLHPLAVLVAQPCIHFSISTVLY